MREMNNDNREMQRKYVNPINFSILQKLRTECGNNGVGREVRFTGESTMLRSFYCKRTHTANLGLRPPVSQRQLSPHYYHRAPTRARDPMTGNALGGLLLVAQ